MMSVMDISRTTSGWGVSRASESAADWMHGRIETSLRSTEVVRQAASILDEASGDGRLGAC